MTTPRPRSQPYRAAAQAPAQLPRGSRLNVSWTTAQHTLALRGRMLGDFGDPELIRRAASVGTVNEAPLGHHLAQRFVRSATRSELGFELCDTTTRDDELVAVAACQTGAFTAVISSCLREL